jgi:hypothetical protein
MGFLLILEGEMDYQAYRHLVSILKKKCPLAFPVNVRRVKLKELYGDCSLDKKKFYIRINRDISEASAIDTLLHEWAHARAWNHLHDSLDLEEFEERSHDASWGVAYSEVYRIYEQCYIRGHKEPKKCFKILHK